MKMRQEYSEKNKLFLLPASTKEKAIVTETSLYRRPFPKPNRYAKMRKDGVYA
jgi:hypothetical protein